MPRTTDAREKALSTAERLFRVQGYAATGLAQILEESGAPRGSTYHHFPEGKSQIAQEALAAYAARGATLIDHVAQRAAGDAVAFVRGLTMAFAAEMERSGWTLGCMAQNLAGELAPGDDAWTARLRDVFAAWTAAISRTLVSCGFAQERADAFATALLAGLEGARTLARVERSAAPFERVATVFAATLAT